MSLNKAFFLKALRSFGFFIAFISIATACSLQSSGFLLVEGPDEFKFEVYSLYESALGHHQFSSVQSGQANKALKLKPGKYVLFSHCSMQEVIVLPNKEVKVPTYSVNFTTTRPAQSGDVFSIECERNPLLNDRFKMEGLFSLNMFSGTWSLLVGLKPMKLTLPPSSQPDDKKPSVINIPLSSLTVTAPATQPKESPRSMERFFIRVNGEALSITQSAPIGQAIYVLPDELIVELNGTSMILNATADHSIRLAGIKVITPAHDFDIYDDVMIRSHPILLTINESHMLSLNSDIFVLPSKLNFSLTGESHTVSLEALPDQLYTFKARALRVNLDCPYFSWDCLGSRKIFLFKKGEIYAESVTDTMIYLLNTDNLEVSLEGTRDLRTLVKFNSQDTAIIQTRFVRFSPLVVEGASGQFTDLVRIEASQPDQSGKTFDISQEEDTTLALIEGLYDLVQYTSRSSKDLFERQRTVKNILVTKGTNDLIPFRVIFPELKRRRWIGEQRKKKQAVLNRQKNLARQGYEVSDVVVF